MVAHAPEPARIEDSKRFLRLAEEALTRAFEVEGGLRAERLLERALRAGRRRRVARAVATDVVVGGRIGGRRVVEEGEDALLGPDGLQRPLHDGVDDDVGARDAADGAGFDCMRVADSGRKPASATRRIQRWRVAGSAADS